MNKLLSLQEIAEIKDRDFSGTGAQRTIYALLIHIDGIADSLEDIKDELRDVKFDPPKYVVQSCDQAVNRLRILLNDIRGSHKNLIEAVEKCEQCQKARTLLNDIRGNHGN